MGRGFPQTTEPIIKKESHAVGVAADVNVSRLFERHMNHATGL